MADEVYDGAVGIDLGNAPRALLPLLCPAPAQFRILACFESML